MGSKSFDLVEHLYEALNGRDADHYGDFYAENSTMRMAGVPRSLGGVLEGRDAIVENLRRHNVESYDVRRVFGDDVNVNVVVKLSGQVLETEHLKGSEAPYTTYESVNYRIEDGLIQEQTSYINWLDVYVQAGLVDLDPLLN